MSRFCKLIVGSLLLMGLGSCSFIDNFSGRSVNFNLEAEQSQLQTLLLNIIRASLNRPMQFTSLSSITGTQSATGSISLLIPFGTHRPPTAATPNTVTSTGTVSASPTFTVPVLDTQEFYQGELTPLTGQEYHFFIEEGYTPAQLLYIFSNAIELTTTDTAEPQHFIFQNYVGNDYDFQQFAIVADYLLSLGLTLEQTRRAQQLGPALSAADIHNNLQGVAALASAGYHIMPIANGRTAGAEGAAASTSVPAEKPHKVKSKKSAKGKEDGQYQIEKSLSIYRPCFDPTVLAMTSKTTQVDKSVICSSNEGGTDESSQSEGSLSRSGGFYAAPVAAGIDALRAFEIQRLRAAGDAQSLSTADALTRLPKLPPNSKFQLRIYTRSTEGILFYLGSVVARHLHPSADGPRVIQVKVGEPYLPYPATPCPPSADGTPQPMGNYLCQSLFIVNDKDGGDSPLSVDYDGKTYSIPQDPKIQGRTLRLVDLVKQLLALHTSAKQLPASNVLNIIGPAQ